MLPGGIRAWSAIVCQKGTASGYRLVFVSMCSIRSPIVLLAVAAIGIAVVPILVMVDLLEGGTGWGLCPGGLEGCESPYTAPFEFLVILGVGVFLGHLAV